MEYILAKQIISSVKCSDDFFPNHYKMNLYRGCNHGCIYCDSRSDCYQLEKFDHVRGKENCISMLDDELSRKRKTGIIATGCMSDPYNYFEKEEQLTRKALKVINKHQFGVWITTKSDLIVRDIDVLQEIAKHSIVYVTFSITASDDNLSNKIEPNVVSSSKRFDAMKQLSDAGIYAGVWLNPVLPFITDTQQNIKNIVRQTYENGGKYIFSYFGMSLRRGNREYYYDKLDKEFPTIKEKYTIAFGERYICDSPRKRELEKIYFQECKKYGLLYDLKEINHSICELQRCSQMSLF